VLTLNQVALGTVPASQATEVDLNPGDSSYTVTMIMGSSRVVTADMPDTDDGSDPYTLAQLGTDFNHILRQLLI
jgi:hypothetical protein